MKLSLRLLPWKSFYIPNTMMSPCRPLVVVALLFSLAPTELLHSQQPRPATDANFDTDGDGLSDDLEQALLLQFMPLFMIDRADCSRIPAEFVRAPGAPKVESENGTIYGQVFPAETLGRAEPPSVEIHFYHLWKKDCGARGHPLDTEHVSVLVRASTSDLISATWKAVYWFAGAHESTVCDVSQVARASTVQAEEHGATVWISRGKHASFLDRALAQHGCGNDLFGDMDPLSKDQLINLGEPGHAMNGSLWIDSPNWPLAGKMAKTDFPPAIIARLDEGSTADIAWFNPGRHPAQGVIAVSGSTANALRGSNKNTASAITLAGDSTNNALKKSYKNTIRGLGRSSSHVMQFLHFKEKP